MAKKENGAREEALKRSLERLETLMDEIPVGVANIDIKGKITYFNKRFEQISGYSREEILGKNAFKLGLFPPETLKLLTKRVKDRLTGKPLSPLEIQLKRKDGKWIWLEERAKLLKERGVPIGLQAIGEDITERKRMEHVLNERVKELQCLYGIGEVAEKADITLDELCQEVVNLLPASWQYPEITCARITINGKEFKTRNYRETEWKQSSDIKVYGAKVGEVEVSYLEERPEIDEGPFLKDERLLINAVAKQLGRITERKRAEEALRESEERLQTYLENAPDGVYLSDLKGTFLYGNKKAEEIIGYEREEIIGKSFLKLNLLPAKHLAKAGKLLALSAMRRPTGPDEFELIRKDGSRLWVEITTAPIKQGGKVVVIGFVRDITERKRMEQQLRETQEQLVRSERLAAIGQLAGGVGHELRNPLGAIKNAVYYIKGKVARSELGQKEPRVMEFLDIMDDEVNSSNKIISDLLGFSRVGKPSVSPTQIENVIEDALLHAPIPENIKLTKKLDADLPEVEIDADQVHQVLVNIITNAVEAMPEGGKLTIAAREREKFLEVGIADTGCGIPQEAMDKIFDPLFTTKAKGIGLGLAVCKAIIDRHEGNIEVKSRVGKGATFNIRLPLKAE